MNKAKEKAQAADFNVACVARLFLNGHVPIWELQAAVDKQDDAYDEWGKELDEQQRQHRKTQSNDAQTAGPA